MGLFSGGLYTRGLIRRVLRYLILKRKKMKLITKEQQKSCENAKICYICKEKFEDKHAKENKYCKGKYRGAAYSIRSLE